MLLIVFDEKESAFFRGHNANSRAKGEGIIKMFS